MYTDFHTLSPTHALPCSGLTYSRIEQQDGEITLTIDVDGRAETLTAEQVLVTTGRMPNTADLGLEEAGIRLAPNGGIVVDDRMRTSKSGVYAAGDVIGRDRKSTRLNSSH